MFRGSSDDIAADHQGVLLASDGPGTQGSRYQHRSGSANPVSMQRSASSRTTTAPRPVVTEILSVRTAKPRRLRIAPGPRCVCTCAIIAIIGVVGGAFKHGTWIRRYVPAK